MGGGVDLSTVEHRENDELDPLEGAAVDPVSNSADQQPQVGALEAAAADSILDDGQQVNASTGKIEPHSPELDATRQDMEFQQYDFAGPNVQPGMREQGGIER